MDYAALAAKYGGKPAAEPDYAALAAKHGGTMVEAQTDTRPPAQRFMQNLVGGAIRGAGSIGATLRAPLDYAEQGLERLAGAPARDVSINEQRRHAGCWWRACKRRRASVAGFSGSGGRGYPNSWNVGWRPARRCRRWRACSGWRRHGRGLCRAC